MPVPIAADDLFATDESTPVSGALFADNGAGPDISPDMQPLTLVAVNGRLDPVGTPIVLPSGALLTVAADGAFSYDPNGAFDIVPVGGSATDTFTYTIVDGTTPALRASLAMTDLDGSNGYRIGAGAAIGSVAAGGDVNGDGFADIVLGMPSALDGAGSATVLFGSASGFDGLRDIQNLTPDEGFVIEGSPLADLEIGRFPGAVGADITLGDFNNDGYSDVAVSAPRSIEVLLRPDPGQPYIPAAAGYIVYGSSEGHSEPVALRDLTPHDGTIIDIGEYTSYGNWSVKFTGDINGDGFDDIVAGNYAYASAKVVFGGTQAVDIFALDGTDGFNVGGSVYYGAAAGDMNGDGIDDIIFSDGNDTAYVVFGRTTPFGANFDPSAVDGTDGFALHGAGFVPADSTLAAIGDVNGDGIDDVAIGAPFAGAAGEVFVVFGTAGGFDADLDLATLDGTDGFIVDGASKGPYIGRSVKAGGDVNGDGIADFIVASDNYPEASPTYVVFGTSDGFPAHLSVADLDGSNGFAITPTNGFGVSVQSAGDVNGDGVDDLLVHDGGDAYVLFGGAGLLADADTAAVTITITGTGEAPTAVADPYTIDEDKTLTVVAADGVLANDVDSPGSVLTASIVSGPSHAQGFSFNADGSFDYSPTANFYGTDSFTYKVTDEDGNTDNAVATISVAPVDDAPIANDDAASTTANAPVTLNVLTGPGADTDVDSALNVIAILPPNGTPGLAGDPITLASGAVVTFAADGTVVYDPAGALDGLAPGAGATDTFTYVVSDAGPDLPPNPFGDRLTQAALAADNTIDDLLPFSLDINGDGFEDVAVRSYLDDGYSLTVLLGSPTGFVDPAAVDGSNGFVIRSGTTHGIADVYSLGDSNVDGRDDIGIHTTSFNYELYLIPGRPSFAPGNLISDIGTLGYPDTRFGSVGDINGDGFEDAAVLNGTGTYGANYYYDYASMTVLFGSGDGFPDPAEIDGSNGFVIRSPTATLTNFQSVGDVNGDGKGDFIVQEEYGQPTSLVFGGTSFAADNVIADIAAQELDGRFVGIKLGDVNGDGYDDFVGVDSFSSHGLGSPGAYTETSLFLGGPSGVTKVAIDEPTGYDQGGVDALGDVNGDGFDDFFVGPATVVNHDGVIVFGRPDIAPGDDPRAGGTKIRDAVRASALGDTNGDGIDDFLLTFGSSNRGETYLVHGRPLFDPAITDTAVVNVTIHGPTTSDEATNGADVLIGTGAGDLIAGLGGDDRIKGGNGDDALKGGTGNDALNGGNGNDDLNGGTGNDLLRGAAGDDRLAGGGGNDTLSGDRGDDVMTGGAGVDRFRVGPNGGGRDVIADFENGVEKIVLSGVTIDAIDDHGRADALVTLSDGSELLLRGVASSMLDASDFLFR